MSDGCFLLDYSLSGTITLKYFVFFALPTKPHERRIKMKKQFLSLLLALLMVFTLLPVQV